MHEPEHWDAKVRRLTNKSMRDARARQHGQAKGELLFALEAAIAADEQGTPLDPVDIKTLADMARRYFDGLDRYPGELGEANLLMRKRDALGTSNRFKAVQHLAKLRLADPISNPLDNETYSKVAAEFGLDRSTLQREVRKRRHQPIVVVTDSGDIVFGPLESLLKRKGK
ncbi:hypothetical protein [Halomonas campaniensis]|uniref:hypothetical protein n=1 Tax=Halomonas campaniensis TaxID=213554 RepID=UPI00356412FD